MTIQAIQSKSTFSVFRNRNFSLMWVGQLISTAGSGLTSMAAAMLVYRVTHGSALAVGLLMMAAAVPTLLVGLVAGVFVDRFDRRRIMLFSDLIRAGLVALLPLLVGVNIAWLYIMVALVGTVGQFFDPAYASILSDLASDEELAAANSFMTVSSIGAQAIGFAAAGFIASQLTIEWAFYLDALTFVFSVACILFIHVATNQTGEETNVASLIRNLRAGFGIINSTPGLRSLFIVYLPVFITFGLNNALMLPFARRALNANEFQYSLIEGIGMLGLVLGSFSMARLGDRLREGQWISISFIGMALLSMLYSQLSSLPPAIIVFAFASAFNAPSVVGRQLIIQRQTPRDARGRVFGAFFVMRDSMFMLGMAGAGLADLFNVRTLFFGQSLAFLVVGMLALILPGLGQPAAEWRRAISLLRTVPDMSGLGIGRLLTPLDFDRLAFLVPPLAGLSREMQTRLRSKLTLHEVPEGTCIIHRQEKSDAAYFIVTGQAVAGWDENGTTRVLEVLNAGDFFGEIAALTGAARTANVVTGQATTLVRVPAQTLREMSAEPQLNRIFLTRMTERMVRMNMIDTSRLARLDQETLRDLRTADPEVS